MEESSENPSSRKKSALKGANGQPKRRGPARASTAETSTNKGPASAANVLEDLGAIVAAIVDLPRYRHLPIGEIAQHFIAPLRAGRVSIANMSRGVGGEAKASLAGFVIWASASDVVASKIIDQINAGTFPLRLSRTDWNSGEDIWLLDVVAPNRRIAATIVAGIIRSFGDKKVKMHPLVRQMVETKREERVNVDQPNTDVENVVSELR